MLNQYRYLVDFNTDELEKEYFDAVIVGSGIAGVYTALVIPDNLHIAILTKETLDISNSVLAQGGIAVSLDKEDSPELHFKDTIFAGAGLCNEDSVWVLVNEAAENINSLCKFGVNFDKSGKGELALGREAAHSKNRIIHVGDATGKEVCDKLIHNVLNKKNVEIKERTFAIDILTSDGKCNGVLAYDEDSGKLKVYASPNVVCATGGYGQLYEYTTNPEVATGDGTCMAYRAGATLMDLEFVQFHPTVLYHPDNKSFLISEAVRGEGARLINAEGKRFMQEYHELMELAPRDVVARSIFKEMKKTNSSNVYLDITFKDSEYIKKRFPTIYSTCLKYGIDITKDYIPVAPAEHYSMGGIKTDAYGRTNIEGFFACGEADCNGIHGANRLASNSLLEGLVFGRRIGQEIANRRIDKTEAVSVNYKTDRKLLSIDRDAIKKDIKRTMTEYVGIERNEQGLLTAREKIRNYKSQVENLKNESIKDFEIQNMLTLSELVINSALERKESRGAHYRSDYSKRDDENWNRHILVQRKI
jgi:L-aspartate oxidase